MVFACGCICTKNIPPAPRPASRPQNGHKRRGCVRQAYKTTKKTAQTGPAAPSFHKTIHHIVAYLGPFVNLLCDFCAQKCIFWRGLRQNSAFYQSKAAVRAKSVLAWRTASPRGSQFRRPRCKKHIRPSAQYTVSDKARPVPPLPAAVRSAPCPPSPAYLYIYKAGAPAQRGAAPKGKPAWVLKFCVYFVKFGFFLAYENRIRYN